MSVAGRKYLKVGNVMLTLVRVTDLSDLLQVADISARQRLYFSASNNNGQSTLMIKLSPDKKSVQELIVTPAVQCHGQCCPDHMVPVYTPGQPSSSAWISLPTLAVWTPAELVTVTRGCGRDSLRLL